MHIRSARGFLNTEEYSLTGLEKKADLFSKVNILVGPNNSGKSRFLRSIFKTITKKVVTSKTPQDMKSKAQGFLSIIQREHSVKEKDNQYIKFCIPRDLGLSDEIMEIQKYINSTGNGTEFPVYAIRDIIDCILEKSYAKQWDKVIEGIINEYLAIEGGIINGMIINNTGVCYIPVNRTIKPLLSKAESKAIEWEYRDVIGERVVYEYFTNKKDGKPEIGEQSKLEIQSGQRFYEDLMRNLLGKKPSRQIISDFEQFLSTEFFEGKKITLVPNKEDGAVNVEIDKDEYPIQDWGDGIQSLVIILFAMFTRSEKEYIFLIEEPELNLHPSMQRRLVEIFLNKKFAKHQVFLTTHSNHFLDLAYEYKDVRAFSFRRGEDKKSIITYNDEEELEILESLGVRSSSVNLANCTVWVEGISDVVLYRALLSKYFEEFGNGVVLKEDLHYAFVIYSGACVSHWGMTKKDKEIAPSYKSISHKVLVIADNPNGKNYAIENNKQLNELFKGHFYELDSIEVENIIQPEVYNEYAKNIYGTEFEPIKSYEDYRKTNMDEFFKRHFPNAGKHGRKMHIGGRKKEFANELVPFIGLYPSSTFTPEAKKITEMISGFIHVSNGIK